MEPDSERPKGEWEVATLAGGCFWCLQPIFQALQGVKQVDVGYSGGLVPDPSYEDVCADTTGHAEVVRVIFDPEVVSFEEVLEVFFSVHDPTTMNRQGPDIGSQYRSAVFYHSPEQKATADRVIESLENEGIWKDAIVTEVTPFAAYWRAEERHQDYYERNPRRPYCRTVIGPKVAKFRSRFGWKLRE